MAIIGFANHEYISDSSYTEEWPWFIPELVRSLKKLFFLFGFVVLSHSCFNQFFYESKGKFFIQRKTNCCFGGFIAFEFTFVLLYDGRWHIKSYMFFPKLQINQSAFVFVIRHPITDTFLCAGSSGFDSCSKLFKLFLYFFWS